MIVRPFQARDAAHLGHLFYSAVHEVGSARYTPAQVDAWAPAPLSEEFYTRRARDGRLLLVVVDGDDRPLAYGDLEPDGHISHLYCAPQATRTGLVATLYDRLEQAAVEQGLTLLHTEASELARSFLQRRGFATIRRRDFILRHVAIHNYRMEKRVASGGLVLADHRPPV